MKRRSPPRHVCIVRGCGAAVPRWKRLCDAHWRLLPFDQRRAIAVAGQEKAIVRVSELSLAAARWIAEHSPAAEAARRMGEAVE
ncbi:MAG TPA: hypothetical protein VGF77_08365 [Allosphingosinicella sp.]|jgi:hypothetical protein